MKTEKLLNEIEMDLSKSKSPETVQSYMYAIRRFINHFPAPQRLAIGDIEKYFADLKTSGKSGEYRKAILAAIKAMYESLLVLELIKEHPCRAFFIGDKKPKGKDFTAFLNLEELELLLSLKKERYMNLANRNKSMISFLIYQGITSKELVELKVRDIDFEEGIVKIKGQGKNRKRNLRLRSNQTAFLMKYIEVDRPKLNKSNTEKLFLGLRGAPMTTDALHEFIHRLSGAFDKEVSPKNIRNSVISNWINEKKIKLEHVKEMAGHRYISSTEAYVKEDVIKQRKAVNSLHSKMFG